MCSRNPLAAEFQAPIRRSLPNRLPNNGSVCGDYLIVLRVGASEYQRDNCPLSGTMRDTELDHQNSTADDAAARRVAASDSSRRRCSTLRLAWAAKFCLSSAVHPGAEQQSAHLPQHPHKSTTARYVWT